MLEKAALEFFAHVQDQRDLVLITVCLSLFLFLILSFIARRVRASSVRRLEDQCRESELQLRYAEQRVDLLQGELAELKLDNGDLQEANGALRVERAEIATRLTAEREAYVEKVAMLAEAKQQLSQEFEALSQRIFAEKQASFSSATRDNLQSSLAPFREQLKEFRARVDDVYDKETRDKSSLREELKQLRQLNQQISEDAVNLTRALKNDTKTQGNWGEVVLERVLEESGLHKGREYETQLSFTDATGKRKQPDVVIKLPEGKSIIIDAKVSLVAYERYCNADTPEDRQQALGEHITSIRQHINGLSGKQYENIEGLRSLDFVLIFVPIEAAFLCAFENHPELFHAAYEKNVILVSPSTLLATLGTVRSLWRHERQNKNAALIAKEAGALHDQFLLVLESLELVGSSLGKSQQAYDKAIDRLSRGRGNVLAKVKNLESLGAKTKKSVPESMLSTVDATVTAQQSPGTNVDANGSALNEQNLHLIKEENPNVG